jgi:hypothetical protein
MSEHAVEHDAAKLSHSKLTFTTITRAWIPISNDKEFEDAA